MDWFRLYHEFASDPKVQMMSEAMQRRLVMLFCLQCSNGLETFHETDRETSIAFALRISADETALTKAEFLRRGFINADWTLRNWGKRQYASDSSTARVQRHREAKKQSETFHETDEKRSSNALEQNRTDTEQNRVTRKRSPKTPLADDFAVSDRVKSWASEKGYSRLSEHLDAFKAKAKANGYTYVDWDAAFMEAIRNDWARLRGTTQSSQGSDSVAATRKL